MSDQATIALIVVAAVIVIGALLFAVVMMQRRRHLKEQFGPEYDRLVESEQSRRAAEAELRERERRHEELDIQPLDPAARDRYAEEWGSVQEQFVDDPQEAVSRAGEVLTSVMRDRGYPADDDAEQRMADLSVEHSRTLIRYRKAYDVSRRAGGDEPVSTEDLRQAMVDYRSLFEELLGPTEAYAARDELPEEPERSAELGSDETRRA